MSRLISRADLDELVGYLSEHGGIMPAALTGFFVACLTAGDNPSRWIPDLYEGDDPRAIELMERYAADVRRGLSRGQLSWVVDREEQRIWCAGYMHYVRGSDVFKAIVRTRAVAKLLVPIGVASGDAGAVESARVDEALARVPDNAASLYLLLEQSRQTVSRTGRNEPCPCGSGKKYKRCCLN